MSALDLRKLNDNAPGLDTCDIDGCIRKGRYALSICGHPVPAESRLAMGSQARLCKPCASGFLEMWSEFNGNRHEEATLEAIQALSGTRVARTEAIFALRDLGYSREAVTTALAGVGRGESVEAILDGLDGPGLEEAV